MFLWGAEGFSLMYQVYKYNKTHYKRVCYFGGFEIILNEGVLSSEKKNIGYCT